MFWQVNSNEQAAEIEAFFASHMNPSIVMNLKSSIEQIRIKARWIQSVRQEHSLPDLTRGNDSFDSFFLLSCLLTLFCL